MTFPKHFSVGTKTTESPKTSEIGINHSTQGKDAMPARSAICPPLLAYAVLILLILDSCAPLPPVASVALPPIPAGAARIWFYRIYDPTESLGRPYIRMNESIIGISDQGGAFYRDVPAGWYHITVDSYGRDLYQFADVALAPGQQEYVKILSLRSWTEWRPGVWRDTFYVAVIQTELAQAEIADYPFLGGR